MQEESVKSTLSKPSVPRPSSLAAVGGASPCLEGRPSKEKRSALSIPVQIVPVLRNIWTNGRTPSSNAFCPRVHFLGQLSQARLKVKKDENSPVKLYTCYSFASHKRFAFSAKWTGKIA